MNAKMQSPPDTANNRQEGNTVKITGRVREPVVLSMKDLCEMGEFEEVKDLMVICGTGTPKGRIESCKGVLLENVIRKADVIKDGHNDTKKMYIVASAPDGYKVVFSWQEIFNSPMGEGIMILTEKDGESFCEKNSELELISAQDYFTGSRIVKGLDNIEVVLVE
jgi:hypothetical protein